MNDLWRSVRAMLQQSPVLWVPAMMAGLLNYWLDKLRHLTIRGIGMQSFLGRFTQPELFWIIAPIGVLYRLAGVCGFVVAMLVTAKLIGKIRIQNRKPNSFAHMLVRNHLGGAVVLGFLATIFAAAVAVILMVPIFYGPPVLMRPTALSIETLVFSMVLAYFIAPLGLKLLARSVARDIVPTQISLGRKCAFVAAGATTALGYAAQAIAQNLVSSDARGIGFSAAEAMFVALPYAPLFVSLSLVVAEGGRDFGFNDEIAAIDERSNRSVD